MGLGGVLKCWLECVVLVFRTAVPLRCNTSEYESRGVQRKGDRVSPWGEVHTAYIWEWSEHRMSKITELCGVTKDESKNVVLPARVSVPNFRRNVGWASSPRPLWLSLSYSMSRVMAWSVPVRRLILTFTKLLEYERVEETMMTDAVAALTTEHGVAKAVEDPYMKVLEGGLPPGMDAEVDVEEAELGELPEESGALAEERRRDETRRDAREAERGGVGGRGKRRGIAI